MPSVPQRLDARRADTAGTAAGMIPPSKPPVRHAGALGWLRRNLFAGVLDSLLTLVAVAALAWLLLPVFDWAVLKGVWTAGSLDECRRIVAAAHGAGEQGACWAVIKANMGPLLFGDYPAPLRWRPALAIGLIVLALMPLLVSRLPRRALWLSALCPVAAYILIRGGFGLEPVAGPQIGGVLLALILAVAGSAMAVALGLMLAIGREFAIPPIRALCAAIGGVLRGVPLIVLFLAMGVISLFTPRGIGIGQVLWLALVLALHSCVWIADAIRRGIAALPRGQWEAAAALGLGYRQAIWRIVLPQALKIAAPQIVHTCIALVRDTTVALALWGGLASRIMATPAWNGSSVELLLFLALLYGVVCFLMYRHALTFPEPARGQPQMAHRS